MKFFQDLGRKLLASMPGNRQSLSWGYQENNIQNLINSGAFRVGFDTLYNLYENVVDVHQSISKIKKAAMKEGHKWVHIEDEEKTPNIKSINLAEEFLNRYHDIQELGDLWTRDRYVAGNTFWQVVKNNAGGFYGLKYIDPRTIVVKGDKYGNVLGYKQRVKGVDVNDFDTDEVAHSIFERSVNNFMLGVSPIEQIIWDAKTELAQQINNWAFYENNAVPSHLLIMDDELDKDQYKELKNEIDKKFKGSKNSFKSGMIPYIKDIKTITPSQKDMKYIETRQLTTKKVVVAFGVDPFVLGYTDGVQRGNADVIYRMFYENTVRPEELYFESFINNKVLPLIGVTDILFKVKPSNYQNSQEVSERANKLSLSGIITINEARKMLGMAPSDNDLAEELMFQGFLLDDLGQETKNVTQIIKEKMIERDKNFYNMLK